MAPRRDGTLRKGMRVQLHPATDRWMMGDRFGTITMVTSSAVRVRLDRSGRTIRFGFHDIGEWWTPGDDGGPSGAR